MLPPVHEALYSPKIGLFLPLLPSLHKTSNLIHIYIIMQEQMETVFNPFLEYSYSFGSLHDDIFELGFQIGVELSLHTYSIFVLCISGYFVHNFGGGEGEEAGRYSNLGIAEEGANKH